MAVQNTLLIFGFGYTGLEIAKLCLKQNWNVIGTSRRPDSFDQNKGYKVINYEKNSVNQIIKSVTHILLSVPPEYATGDPVLNEFSDIISENASNIKWLGYLSSTGVYGNYDGAWIDESDIPTPENETGKARINAEKGWLEFGKKFSIPTAVFRLAGIYGPERNYLLDIKMNRARIIDKKGHVFNRIHVEDIANILYASMVSPKAGEVYNVCDNEPASPVDVANYAAGLLKMNPPEPIAFEKADLSGRMKEFYNSSKRIRNNKVKELLGKELTYPTYREGLDACFKMGL